MQVDRRNFDEVFPDVLEKLKRCSFVAIDAEFSGLGPPPGYESAARSLFDSAERRYMKARKCTCYFTCQVGLAFHRRLEDSNLWESDCYNFYVHPTSYEDFGQEERVIWEVSSINFLKEFHFDFDRVCEYGIPFMKNSKAEKFRDYLLGGSNKNLDDINDLVEKHRGFSRIIAAISESCKPIVGHNMYTDLILLYHHFIEDIPESYEEYKIQIHRSFPSAYDTKVLALNMKKQLSTRHSNEDLSYLSNTALCALYKSTSDAPGHCKPQIHLATSSEIYKDALAKGKIEDLEVVSSTKCHEAGFDACVTGAVFIQLAYILWQHELAIQMLPQTLNICDVFGLFNSWMNLINLSRARLPYINLAGKDPRSHRPPLFYIDGQSKSDGSKALDLKLIVRHMSNFGGCEGIYADTGKKKALIACTGDKGFELGVKYLKQAGYSFTEVRIPSDDNTEAVIPWRKFAVCSTVAWSLMAAILWMKCYSY